MRLDLCCYDDVVFGVFVMTVVCYIDGVRVHGVAFAVVCVVARTCWCYGMICRWHCRRFH